MSVIADELHSRWLAMFEALARGEGLTPGLRLRTEGMMEAALLCEGTQEEALTAAMGRCFLQATGQTLVEAFGDQWREFYPFPQIPAVTERAPVYPSTKD